MLYIPLNTWGNTFSNLLGNDELASCNAFTGTVTLFPNTNTLSVTRTSFRDRSFFHSITVNIKLLNKPLKIQSSVDKIMIEFSIILSTYSFEV